MENKIIVSHDAGFYSNCTIRLKHIVDFYNEYKIYPIVDSSRQWSHYKDAPGDISSIFFKENNLNRPPIESYLAFNDSESNQFSDYKKLDYKNLGVLIDIYFQPADEILDIVEMLLNKYNLNLEKTIGVCYRGNDKQQETNLPSHEETLNKIVEIKNIYPGHNILVQSDEAEFYSHVLEKYPEAIYFNEILKMPKNVTSAIQYNVQIGSKLNQAKIFYSILLILSKCSQIIFNSGNVGLWVCLYRGCFDNAHQYLNQKEYIYGIRNEKYNNSVGCWLF